MPTSNLSRVALNDEGFMFDPQTGQSFLVNDTARFLIEGLKEGQAQDELSRQLAAEWPVDESQATRDVVEFMQQLRILGLIT